MSPLSPVLQLVGVIDGLEAAGGGLAGGVDGLEGGLGGQHAGLHGGVRPLDLGHVHETGAAADQGAT